MSRQNEKLVAGHVWVMMTQLCIATILLHMDMLKMHPDIVQMRQIIGQFQPGCFYSSKPTNYEVDVPVHVCLTHSVQATRFGDIDLRRYWLKYWLVDWRH